MELSQILVTIMGLGLSAFVIWFFLLAKTGNKRSS